jgi:hypothetical protein
MKTRHPSELQGKIVYILTPANYFSPCYVESLFNLSEEAKNLGIQVKFFTYSGSHVGQLREKMIVEILNTTNNYDFLFWIDSDISFTTNDFLKLLCSPYEITCGVYLISQDGRTSISKEHTHVNVNNLDKMQKYTEVDACGFGFISIKNGVFEKMNPPFFANIVDNEGNFIETSEDSSWCQRVKTSGCKIACDTTVRLGHDKPSIWGIKPK